MIFQITHLKRLLFSSLVFLLPGVVEGLGLGKISSYSGINEPFVGVVEVKGISAEQIDKLTVSLASPEEFKYAGLNYSKHVGSLRFTPSRSASGKPIIRISSAEAITEPFLGIVLNIKSASGSASKEYMVALEPETTTSTVKAVSEPVGQEKSYQINDETNNQLQQKAVVFPLRHGPIQTQESLLGIAKSYSVPGVSASQIAMAFYRYNQDAFIRGDINRLRAGAVLQIPQHDAILETTRGVAEMELQHLIRGEPVVVSLPQIAPQTDLPLPTDDSESVPRQTPNEKISSSGDQLVGSKGATESQARSDEEHEKNYPPSISSYPLNYGPVRAGESLESVARQLGPNDASLSQTALAIFKHNPKAFIKGDIRKIRSGVKLTIPDPKSIYELPPDAAKKAYQAALRGQDISSAILLATDASQVGPQQNQVIPSSAAEPLPVEVIKPSDTIARATTPTPQMVMTDSRPKVTDHFTNVAMENSPSNMAKGAVATTENERGMSPDEKPDHYPVVQPTETDHLVIAMQTPAETIRQTPDQQMGQNLTADESQPAIGTNHAASEAQKATSTDIQKEMLLIREAGESNHQEYLNLHARVIELETQIANMQKLLLLSTDQINQLLDLVSRNSTTASAPLIAEYTSSKTSFTDLPRSEINKDSIVISIGLKTIGLILLVSILGVFLVYWKYRRSPLSTPLTTVLNEPNADLPETKIHSPDLRHDAAKTRSQLESIEESEAEGPNKFQSEVVTQPAPLNNIGPGEDHNVSLDTNLIRLGDAQPGLSHASSHSNEGKDGTYSAKEASSISDQSEPNKTLPGSAPASDTAHGKSHWQARIEYPDEIEEKIDLSMAYIQTHRNELARILLRQVVLEGNSDQQSLARSMLDRLG